MQLLTHALTQSLPQWTNLLLGASIVVTGHLTRSIAAYATRSSQVKNDNSTKVVIPWNIHIDYDLGI